MVMSKLSYGDTRGIKRRTRPGIPLPGELSPGGPRKPGPHDGRFGFPRELLIGDGMQLIRARYRVKDKIGNRGC